MGESLWLWFVCRVHFRGACTGAMEGGVGSEATEPQFSWVKGKVETPLGFLCPAWLLGLIHRSLIITLCWPPFKMRSGQRWEKVQSHGEGAVQALVWEAGCPLQPLAC